MRYDIVKFIYHYQRLPLGDEQVLVTSNDYGISYAFQPYLAYIISSLFLFLAFPFNIPEEMLYRVARLSSILFALITIAFLYKISKEMKMKNKLFLPFLVGIFPQFCLISSYVNNDSLAITSTSILIYSWLIGLKSKWDKKSIIYLIVGLSLCVSSYYNSYGFLIVSLFLFIASYLTWYRKEKSKRLLKQMFIKGSLVFAIVFQTSSWWFLKNLYFFGDIFGQHRSREMALKYAVSYLKPVNRKSLYARNYPFSYLLFNWPWLMNSAKSFIGVFGQMKIFMSPYYYYLYLIFLLIGIVAAQLTVMAKKKFSLFDLSLILSALSVLILHFSYSYFMDYQPQGRYLLPMLVIIMIWTASGWEKIAEKLKTKYILTILVIFCLLINLKAISVQLVTFYPIVS